MESSTAATGDESICAEVMNTSRFMKADRKSLDGLVNWFNNNIESGESLLTIKQLANRAAHQH